MRLADDAIIRFIGVCPFELNGYFSNLKFEDISYIAKDT